MKSFAKRRETFDTNYTSIVTNNGEQRDEECLILLGPAAIIFIPRWPVFSHNCAFLFVGLDNRLLCSQIPQEHPILIRHVREFIRYYLISLVYDKIFCY